MPNHETTLFRTFFIAVSLVVALCLSGIFFGLALRSNDLIQDEIVSRARAHFNSILLTRRWNAIHGGVFVLKKDGVESNPYLPHPDIEATDGRVFTMRNPALMTREISELAQKDGLFKFHITSLKPLNPGNAADAFEQDALRAFEQGAHEFTRTETMNNQEVFRYMGPLMTEPPCMACHAHQGYTIGDVRGGVSVTFEIGELQRKLAANTLTIVVLGVTVIVLLVALIFFLFRTMRQRLAAIHQRLIELAMTDDLTGIANRRHILERFREEFLRSKRTATPMGCIMIDIDHFKAINDTYGHEAGDVVLKNLAATVTSCLREYDLFGRLGGEEFLIVAPGADVENLRAMAERLRQHIGCQEIPLGEGRPQFTITVSMGVAMLDDDESIDALLRRADQALYAAKASGRNRVECCELS